MIVSQLMSRNITTCTPQDSLADAARKMWEQDIGCLPVLDAEGHVNGIVTDRDACMAAYTQGRPLSAISVDSAMARCVHSCRPTDRIEAVEAVMKAHQVRRVPVIDREGHLVGLVSMNDIARESADELMRRSPDVRTGDLVSTLARICEPRRAWTMAVASP
ncbi:MAG TPA: CBS domain-containing protein [Polyangiaceae bacterium]